MNKKRLAEHLEKLNTFKTVADLKSVHKASSRLGLSQPAVSRTVKVLEDVLECRLIVRESRGVSLTNDGQRLYEYAKLIAKTIDSFDSAGNEPSLNAGPFRIATYDNIASHILSYVGKELLAQIPNLSIATSGTNTKILGDLIGGKFDCAFIAQPRILTGLEYKKVFSERYGLFAASDFFKKTNINPKKILTAEDLKEFQLIAMPDAIAGSNKSIDRLLWEVGLKSPLAIDSYNVAMQLTRDGLGIGIMPYSTAWRDLREKRLIELQLKGVSKNSFGAHELSLCWNPKQIHPGLLHFERIMENFVHSMSRN